MRIIMILTITAWSLAGFTQQRIWSDYKNSSLEGDLPRRAHLGFRVGSNSDLNIFDAKGIKVSSIEQDSPVAKAGLKLDDELVEINGKGFQTAIQGREMLNNLSGEKEINLSINRNTSKIELKFTPESEPLEDLEGVTTIYSSLVTDTDDELRVILTIPKGTKTKVPAILISDWTSCSSTEVPTRIQRGWINFVRGLIETTGAIVMRVDKPGVGDSQGFCSELDFNTSVNYQTKALEVLKSHPLVDPNNIFIDGESVGAFMAPLIAQNQDVKGIIVRAGGASTWFERMMIFERLQRELSGKALTDIDREMKLLTEFYFYYLIKAMPLEEIFEQGPEMKRAWDLVSHNSANKHYGRPISFHQQAQQHNFAQAWMDSGARALVLIGEYEQFESIESSRLLVNAVNSINPGYAELKIYPKANHQLELFDSHEASLAGYSGPQIKPEQIGVEQPLADVREWMNQLMNEQ